MYKSSFIIVVIQLFSIVLGFISIYIVAGDMAPEVYSLVGVYTVVSGVILTFSQLGVETTMMREALLWLQKGDTGKVTEYTTQSILSRFIGFALIAPFILLYLAYLNIFKYDGHYTILFVSFFIGACMSSLNDSMSLMVRSHGGYVFSQFAKSLNVSFMKFVAILVYIKWGALPYLYFYALYSIPLLFIFVNRLHPYFSCRYINVRATFSKIKDAKFLVLRSYLDYFYSYADSIVVSIVFPTYIMGSYSILKNLENILRQFIEGFFDVLSQRNVKCKCDYLALCKNEKSYNKARIIAAILLIIGILIYSVDTVFFINIVNLSKYIGIQYILYAVCFIGLFYLLGKYEISAISILAPSKTNFLYGCATCCLSVLAYVWLFAIPALEGMLLQRLTTYLLSSLLAIVIFRRKRHYYYSNILK